jgi:hypothetical protein
MEIVLPYLFYKKQLEDSRARQNYSLGEPQSLYIITLERSNHIVLTAILEGEIIKIIIYSEANRVYPLIELAKRLR